MISVCIATHNGEKYIKEQIKSILPQLSDDDEIIVSDDGSTDNTISIIESIDDSRIRVVSYENKNKNLPSVEKATLNFYNALRHSNGDYIFLADQDDVWTDDKVSVTLGYLKDYPYVVSDCYVTDGDLNVVSETRFLASEKVHYNKYAALVLSTPYQGSCTAFGREVLEKAMPFPNHLQSHDRWIGDVAAFFFGVKIIPEKLIYYRRHEGTASNSFGKVSGTSKLKTIWYKWVYVKGIIKLKLFRRK